MACRPGSAGRRSRRSAKSGWSRTGGGPPARFGAATSSSSPPTAPTAWSSATSRPGAGSPSGAHDRMYVELHAHSAYSFLDGASTPEELVAAAAVHGHSALALTDHDGLWGAMEFAQAAKGLGIKAITGAELTLTDGSHLTLLVQDRAG